MKKFILILLLLFLTTGCSFTNNKTKEKDSEVKEEAYILNEEQKTKVDNIVNLLELKYDDFNFNKLSDQDKIQLLYKLARILNINEYGYEYNSSYEAYLNKKNFEMIAREYFGEGANFNLVDIDCLICGKVDFYYDESIEAYHFNEDHLGHGFSAPIIQRKEQGITKKGDIVSVKYKILFSNVYDIGAPSAFYKTLDDAWSGTNEVATFADYCWGDDMDFGCDYNKMFSEKDFYTYSYNFKLDGDNFYFLNYTIK